MFPSTSFKSINEIVNELPKNNKNLPSKNTSFTYGNNGILSSLINDNLSNLPNPILQSFTMQLFLQKLFILNEAKKSFNGINRQLNKLSKNESNKLFKVRRVTGIKNELNKEAFETVLFVGVESIQPNEQLFLPFNLQQFCHSTTNYAEANFNPSTNLTLKLIRQGDEIVLLKCNNFMPKSFPKKNKPKICMFLFNYSFVLFFCNFSSKFDSNNVKRNK